MGIISKLLGIDPNTGDLAYLKDGRLASFNFGQTNGFLELNNPRQKFLYFVKINFNQSIGVQEYVKQYMNAADLALIIPLVKSIQLPTIKIATNKLNQYNRWRISQSKIDYDPINMTFYDVADGKSLRFWEMYYEYYFRNGVNSEKITKDNSTNGTALSGGILTNDVNGATYDDDFGFGLDNIGNDRYLIETIEIYQVHGGNYSKTILAHPRISVFSQGDLTYTSMGDLCEVTMTLEYEDVVYYNYHEALNDEELAVFQHSQYHESQMSIPVRNPMAVNNRSKVIGIGKDAMANVSDDSFFGKLGKAFGKGANLLISDLTNTALNAERGVSSLLDAIPGALASGVQSAVFTGKFTFPLDIKSSANNILQGAIGGVIGSGKRSLSAVVTDSTGAVVDVAKGAYTDTNTANVVTSLDQHAEYVNARSEITAEQNDAFNNGVISISGK